MFNPPPKKKKKKKKKTGSKRGLKAPTKQKVELALLGLMKKPGS